jgi:hypothetical protein
MLFLDLMEHGFGVRLPGGRMVLAKSSSGLECAAGYNMLLAAYLPSTLLLSNGAQ